MILDQNDKGYKTFRAVESWHEIHERSRSPYFALAILLGMGRQNTNVVFDHRAKYIGTICDHITISLKEYETHSNRGVEYLKKNPGFLLDLMHRAYGEHQAAIEKWTKNDTQDFGRMSAQEMSAVFRSYSEDLLGFGIYVIFPFFAEKYFEDYLKQEYEKRFGEKASFWFGVACDPILDGTVLLEEIDRLTMVASGKTDEVAVQNHLKKYSWMANTGFFETYYGADYYRDLMKMTKDEAKKKLEEIRAHREEQKKNFSELLKQVADDEHLVALTKTANESVFFRSYRTEMFYGSPRFNQNLFREVGKRLGLGGYKDFLWLYWDEICLLLEKGEQANEELIASRKEAFVLLSDQDLVYYHWDGEAAKQVLREYLEVQKKTVLSTELKGNGAFKGKVRGRVVVIRKVSENKEVQPGDILVTHATNVNFVPILQKVSGIITEEGGILSHAAIISRELRIPCIIGTKIATSVLKDGDIIELDSEKGTIVKLDK